MKKTLYINTLWLIVLTKMLKSIDICVKNIFQNGFLFYFHFKGSWHCSNRELTC